MKFTKNETDLLLTLITDYKKGKVKDYTDLKNRTAQGLSSTKNLIEAYAFFIKMAESITHKLKP